MGGAGVSAVGEFDSIPFDGPVDPVSAEPGRQPACFADLLLDRVVAAVVAGRGEYDLTPWLYAPVRDPATVTYRHEVFRDLDDTAVYRTIEDFADRMRRTRQLLSAAEQARYAYQPQRYVLEAAVVYGEAVTGLRDGLACLPLRSRGLQALRGWLTEYGESPRFTSLVVDTRQLLADLAKVRYTVHVHRGRVTVGPFRDEPDYRPQVEATFERFPYPAADVGSRPVRRGSWDGLARYLGMNHVDSQIVERVARLYPDTFQAFLAFPNRHAGFLDETIATFDRQVQFYLAWLDYLRRFRKAGLPICYPQVSTRSRQTRVEQGYDLVLADTLLPDRPVVLNDVRLGGGERVVVVTGPNQGGKTTFARMLGQLHYLAGLGCPVPARGVLHRMLPRGWRERLTGRPPGMYSFQIPDRDEAGHDAVAELRNQAVAGVATALDGAVGHVLGFFAVLRAELAFYLGCLNLHQRLTRIGASTCLPTPRDVGAHTVQGRGLYDPCLALILDAPAVGGDLTADNQALVVVTGANQGGKSTFLRAVGVAQLMLRAGMFVPADSYRGAVQREVFTHFKREEDPTMTHGKLDEELVRMSQLVDQLTPGSLLLCNESFASTNEQDGSEIAQQVVGALTKTGVTVYYVTHLYELAHRLHQPPPDRVLFLRAERTPDGTRTFRIVPGAPEPTSHGEDSYRRILGPADAPAGPLDSTAGRQDRCRPAG
jgi:hypothetical protein